MFEYARLYLGLFENIWICLDMLEICLDFWICLNMFDYAWIWLKMFEYIQTYFRAYPKIFKHFQSYPSIVKHIQAYPNIFSSIPKHIPSLPSMKQHIHHTHVLQHLSWASKINPMQAYTTGVAGDVSTMPPATWDPGHGITHLSHLGPMDFILEVS